MLIDKGAIQIMSDLNINEKTFAVIGGGPSGSLTALVLKKRGARVYLFEKSSFPLKHKVCGEYLCPSGKNALINLGLEKLVSFYPKVYGMKIVSPSGNVVSTIFPNDEFGYALRRDQFDNDLLETATTEGVKIFYNTKINNIEFDGHKIKLKSNELTWEVDFLIGADGRSSFVSKWLHANEEFKNKRVALHAYLPKKTDQDSFNQGQMHIFSNHSYCGLNPVAKDLWNFSIVCNADLIKNYESVSELVVQTVKNNKILEQNVDVRNIRNENIKVISNLTHPVKKIAHIKKRTLLVGDASGFVDPLTGEGMYHAIQTAICLDKAIFDNTNSWENVFEAYEKFVSHYFHNKVRINYFFQWLIKKEALCNIIANVLNCSQHLRNTFIGLIGNVFTPSESVKYYFKGLFIKLK